MGQKVSPLILRIGYIKDWKSRWFADKKDFARNVIEDSKIRSYIIKKFAHAAVSHVDIERLAGQVRIKIASARPGVIIGRRGADIDRLKEDLSKVTPKELAIDIQEIKNPAINANLVAQSVALQLEKRIAFRRAMKRAIEQAMNSGVKGIKISCSGRLGGAEMCRRETYKEGKLPLQTFRADIDYGFYEAHTTYGTIGVKAWIYHGDAILDEPKEEIKNLEPEVKAEPIKKEAE
ncbi:MAG: 30S ribosomal protein S3 [Candidatus Omnitrophica bacterium]|nr:30S ribosomal protein S3 [Candidatus Omnitrophota bacterium]